MKNHILIAHENVNPFSCELCNKSFSNPGNLTFHVKKFHETVKLVTNKAKKIFECSLCDKIYKSKGKLDFHNNQVHEKKLDYQCTVCSKQFSNEVILSRHIEQVHEKSSKVKCAFCESLVEKKYLKYHITSIHDQKKSLE